uniref:Uncharacterized protein n=1 Tax=Romanomermis culicivorax TaxID=13658 RepID=A0A915JF77_ROMCU
YELPIERRIRINQLKSSTVAQLFKFDVGSVFLVERFSEKCVFPEENCTFTIDDKENSFIVEGQ